MADTAKLRQLYLVVMALLAWLAIALQMFLVLRIVVAEGRPAITGIINTLSYFTILTNLLIAIVVTASARRRDSASFLTRPGTMSATAVYIAIVGLIYSLVLRSLWEPTGLQLLADETLHDVMPILYVIYWFFFVPKGTLRWTQPVYWLIYPLAYFVYCLIRGALTSLYPYPFVDVTALGYPRVLVTSAGILAGFLVAGLILVALDQLIARSRSRERTSASA